MPVLFLDWGALGPYGGVLDGTQTVNTGGVNVAVAVVGETGGDIGVIVDLEGYVDTGEPFSPNSHLKLFGDGLNPGGTSGPGDVSTTTLAFSSADPLYGDEVTNVSFRLNDIDGAAVNDLDGGPGVAFEDIISIRAFDADGNPVAVTLTPGSAVDVIGNTATGGGDNDLTSPEASMLVEIAGPVARVEIDYDNGEAGEQSVIVSDVYFETTDPDGNTAPDAVNDTVDTDLDTAVLISVLANDSDPESDPLTVTGASVPANGTATVNPDGTITYTPDAGFTGTETITYTISDGNGGEDTADVVITVAPGNLPPDALNDSASTLPNDSVIIPVLDNDSDPESDPLIITGISSPSNGIAFLTGDGTITYEPNPNFSGTDTFTYTITDGNGNEDTATVTVVVSEGRIDTDVFPVDPTLQPIDPLDGLDEDPDPLDDLDSIEGTTGDDFIRTGDDADTIIALAGDDTIQPGIDNDIVEGRGGNDLIIDIQGADTIGGGSGDDTINAGTNTFSDYAGDDTFFGPGALGDILGFDRDPNQEDGRDSVTGGVGNDVITTGDDRDTIDAGADDDFVDGGIDDDSIFGASGDDELIGSHGSDTIDGGQGNDYIDAGNFDVLELIDDNGALSDTVTINDLDSVIGGTGNDTIFTGDDRDTISGDGGNDLIDAGIDDDSILGGGGADTIFGGQGSDFVDGGDEGDLIDTSNIASREITDDTDAFVNDDRDTVLGGQGDDTITTGDDADSVDGGTGDDLINLGIDEDIAEGDSGSDTIFGGAGNDTIDGGEGIDELTGGADRDVFIVNSAIEGTGDIIDGSVEGDDFDRLDLTGVGVRGEDWRITNETDDINGNGINGTIEFLDRTDGSVTGTMDFFEIEEIVPCFTPGTTIATPTGQRLVEDLQVGDRVITRDNGLQEIRWIGQKELTGHQLARVPHLKPILIQAGSLGPNLPAHDMLVSPNHRVLVNNDKTSLYFEEREVLAAAKHLTGLEGVDEVGTLGVTYVHFMCDNHEVVLSNGAWTETFQPGDYTMSGMGNAQRNEIFELFPDLKSREGLEGYTAARRSLKRHEAELITK
ncbi:MAG: Hint domain-containing protein [Marinovum sp.]|nr:Hint domain-containing protein [Marinovum sp.]